MLAVETPPVEQVTALTAGIARRFLAKAVDVTLFGMASVALGRLLLPEQLTLQGLVPATVTALWVLSFYVAADTVAAQLMGATPGEYLAGIRVRMLDGAKLTWSARQDRTTDALVEGTLGIAGLLRSLSTGRPAPYDRDWCVLYLRATRFQRFFAAATVVLTIACLVALGVWVTLLRGLDADVEVAGRKFMARMGFPVQDVWFNPLTGSRVPMPEDWYVRQSTFGEDLTDAKVEFECSKGPSACRIVLLAMPQAIVGMITADRDGRPESMQRVFKLMLGEDDVTILNFNEGLEGDARLNQIYVAELSREGLPDNAQRVGLVWFTEKKNSWFLTMTLSSGHDETSVRDRARALALGIIQSAMTSRDK
jgi:hypothetical protein